MVSYFSVKTPLEASSESKHPSDLSSLLFSLPPPLCTGTIVGCTPFTPQPLPTSHPTAFLRRCSCSSPPPPLPPHTHTFLLTVCLLRLVILTALLLLLPRPSVVSLPSALSPFSLRTSIVLVPFLLSRPSFSASSSCFFSSPPCLSPL